MISQMNSDRNKCGTIKLFRIKILTLYNLNTLS